MAKRTITQVVTQTIDDLDGTSLAQTVTFDLCGQRHQIDLSRQNEQSLLLALQALQPFLDAATAAVGSKPAPAPKAAKKAEKKAGIKGSITAAQLRTWAIGEGFSVPLRGPVPKGLYQEYAAAQRKDSYRKRHESHPVTAMERKYPRAEVVAWAYQADLIDSVKRPGRLPLAVYTAYEDHLLSAEMDSMQRETRQADVVVAAEEVAAAEAHRLSTRSGGRGHGRIYPSDLRPWARAQGYRVSNGAIHADVLLAYALAHPGALV